MFLLYASLPFNGAGMVVLVTADPKSPIVATAEQINKTAKVIIVMPQTYYHHMGGGMRFGTNSYLYVGQGDGGWVGSGRASSAKRTAIPASQPTRACSKLSMAARPAPCKASATALRGIRSSK